MVDPTPLYKRDQETVAMSDKIAKDNTYREGSAPLGGGGDGGDMSDHPTREEMNAKIEASRAQNDARFAEIIVRLDHAPTTAKVAGLIAAGVATAVAIAAFAFDRFDGGVGVSAIIDSAVVRATAGQAVRDAAQDAKLDQILEAVSAQPKPSPEAPKAP